MYRARGQHVECGVDGRNRRAEGTPEEPGWLELQMAICTQVVFGCGSATLAAANRNRMVSPGWRQEAPRAPPGQHTAQHNRLPTVSRTVDGDRGSGGPHLPTRISGNPSNVMPCHAMSSQIRTCK